MISSRLKPSRFFGPRASTVGEASGRILPTLRPAATPHEGVAGWRIVAPSDPRPARLAAAMPPSAHALRTSSGALWAPERLLMAFLDAVADACARQGRRPQAGGRRRGSANGFGEAWTTALGGTDPVVSGLRVPADDLVADLADWASPLAGGRRGGEARLGLRLTAPDGDEAGAATRDAWRLHLRLRSVRDPEAYVGADEIWEEGPLMLAGEPVTDAELVLADGLAAGARLFAPLDRCLDAAHPTHVDLADDEVAELLDDGASALAAAGITVELPRSVQGAEERRLRLRLRIGQGTPLGPRVEGAGPLALDSLADLRYEAALGDEAVDLDEIEHLVAGGRPLVRWRGSWVRVDADDLERIRRLAGEDVSLGLTEVLAAALSGQHLDDDLGWVDVVADGEVGAQIERLRSSAAPAQAEIVGIDGELRAYQERGVAWLQRLTELGLGGVLADQMGLGKTLQAIALLTSRPQDRPQLVVCPTSVVGNWERELARFAPTTPVVRHHGPDRPVTPRGFPPGAVVVTSYALLRQDLGILADTAWDVVVFDEAQQIKNPASKGAKAARALSARSRIALTGTPVENRLSELWAIVDVTNPGLLGTPARFAERFAVPIERWRDEDAAARLRRLVSPFVLRRRKDDPQVHADLPAKQELVVPCSLTVEQVRLYQSAVDAAFSGRGLGSTSFERRGQILALLTALKQICNHPTQYLRDSGPLERRSGKLTRATEILTELVDDGDRALVFTQFRQMGELLATHLAGALGVGEVPFLHGGVSLGRRDEMVRRFQEDEDAPPVLLVSLRAGGVGVNLTRAKHVVHYDRWWNPAVEDQATDRAHRIGQEHVVTVHALVTEGTVEERIAALLERKRHLADAVVGTGEAWITELDDDELRDLVALSDAAGSDDDIDDDIDGPDVDEPGPQPGERPRLVALPGGRR